MPLEIQIKFTQKGVFFAGEKVSLSLTFHNLTEVRVPSTNPQSSLHSSSPSLDSKVSYNSLTSSSAIDLYRPLLSPSLLDENLRSPVSAKVLSQSKSLPNLYLPPHTAPAESSLFSTFSNFFKPKPSIVSPLRLLFATAHVIGTFQLDPQWINTNGYEKLRKITGCVPSLENYEYPILINQPTLLFVDITLAPDQSREFIFHTLLPKSLPPTYRGKAVRFMYKVVVQVQPSGKFSKPWVSTAPFRLFSTIDSEGSLIKFDVLQPIILSESQGQVVDPALPRNPPTLKSPEEVLSLLQRLDEDINDEKELTPSSKDWVVSFQNGMTLRQIQTCLLQATSPVFDLSQSGASIAKLQLSRSVFRLGECIQGIVDFRASKKKMVHVSVGLESLESTPEHASTKKTIVSLSQHAHMHSCVQSTMLWPFELAIPESASQSLETSIVSLKYQLSIELLLAKPSLKSFFQQEYADRRHMYLVGKPSLELDVIKCQLPLTVLPALFTNYCDHVSFTFNPL